jgi:transcriptional regulator with XRE-family HTH domain
MSSLNAMTNQANPLGAFLRARRSQVDPSVHGIPAARRRVTGLRREEVAQLAGVSSHYYARLEQGRNRHPSSSVLDALARVLDLDEQGRAHLDRLSVTVGSSRGRAPSVPEQVRPGLAQLLQQWTGQAAMVLGRYRDVMAANPLATAINPNFAPGHNLMREVFLDPAARTRYPDWEVVGREGVAALRASVGADVEEPERDGLVDELSAGSAEFRRMWAQHTVREKPGGRQRFWNPLVGTLTLDYEPLAVPYSNGQILYVFFAMPGSEDAAALDRLRRT